MLIKRQRRTSSFIIQGLCNTRLFVRLHLKRKRVVSGCSFSKRKYLLTTSFCPCFDVRRSKSVVKSFCQPFGVNCLTRPIPRISMSISPTQRHPPASCDLDLIVDLPGGGPAHVGNVGNERMIDEWYK